MHQFRRAFVITESLTAWKFSRGYQRVRKDWNDYQK